MNRDEQCAELVEWCRNRKVELKPRVGLDESFDPSGVTFSDRPRKIAAELVNRLASLGYDRAAASINVSSCTNARVALGALGEVIDGFAAEQSTPPKGDLDGDPVEETLSGQMLDLYLLLKQLDHWTSFDTLLDERELWRSREPNDRTVIRALRRFRDGLNALDCPFGLTIDTKHRRTKLTQ